MPDYGTTTPKNPTAPRYGGTVGAHYTPQQAAEVAANIANEESSLAALVSRDYTDDLLGGGKAGAPIFIRQPVELVARSRAIDDVETEIVMDTISEEGVTLNLSRQMDGSAVALDEADMNLNLTDFAGKVLRPQARSVVALLEDRVRHALRSVDSDPGELTYDPTNPVRLFTRIRKRLRDNGVPIAGLQVLVGTGVYADLLDAKAITDVSESGSTAALREAAVGKVRGMLVVERADLDDYEVIAFHRNAVVLATRAPAVPVGHTFGQMVSEKGFSLRYLRDYLAQTTVHRSYVSTFSAVGIMPTFKVERNHGDLVDVDKETGGEGANVDHGRSVTVTQIPNGGIFRLADVESLTGDDSGGGDDGGVVG